MRDYWIDHHGKPWIEPKILGRLKMRIPAHAALRAFVIHRDGSKCRRCSATTDLIADHIISRRNGGRHHPSNMQCLCQLCNARKSVLEDRHHA
ncbi:HNH endonuclease [Comamonas sp. JUb58]|uniref:HNH endonuclease n=1 Tax=Comamonas sp. JUb58 TaxID=2485114 RepID=UPI001AAED678|nr:HNH endonuclease [Comamonas sp. JUb58]